MIADLPPAHPIVQINQVVQNHVLRSFPHGAKGIRVQVTEGSMRDFMENGSGGALYGIAYKSQARIVYGPGTKTPLYNAYARIAAGKKLNERQTFALQIALHENLHIIQGEDYWDPRVRQADEAATDAVTLDLFPGMMRSLTGRSYAAWDKKALNWSRYSECVKSVRFLSGKATGGPWKRMPARAWRYHFFLSGAQAKADMLRSQGVNLGELCTVLP